jgi:putative phosphoserine phosphatase/1-acylglycerol-3-phosphate O-acyltransferase
MVRDAPAYLDAWIGAVRAGPSGPRIGAFFDLADVLVADPDARAGVTARQIAAAAGTREEDLAAAGERRFRGGLARALFHEAWQLVKAHQQQGHTVVLVTSTTPDRAGPVARELGIEHVVCTPLHMRDGVATGRPGSAVLRGAEKVRAVRELAATHGVDLRESHAYVAAAEEQPLLEACGHPAAVNPDPALASTAHERHWPVLRFRAPATDADPVAILRTAAAYGGFFAAAGAGVATGLVRRRRRPGIDAATSLWGQWGPVLAGLRVEVQGEEHVWEQRPAVFMVNHQSHLVDALVTFRLLKRDFTAVAKKEAADMPAVGPALRLADWAFVERVTGDRRKAIASMQPAVDKLHAGVSIVIAPEGTRSVGPTVGPFKKGGFHMAMQAGVPVVPVILRNTGDLMWRSARTLRSGTVEVLVHPPISVADWKHEDLDERIAEVRQIYVDALEDWPASEKA